MKIIQILSLLIYIICFSCVRETTVDTNGIANERKRDSIDRIQFLAHSDSIQKMYTSIKIPHIWNEVKILKGKTTIIKCKDTLYKHQEIYIDISTEPQTDIIWNLENEKSRSYTIKNVLEQGDSAVFNTIDRTTEKPIKWVFKYINKEKTLGAWSMQTADTKTIITTGKFISVKGPYE